MPLTCSRWTQGSLGACSLGTQLPGGLLPGDPGGALGSCLPSVPLPYPHSGSRQYWASTAGEAPSQSIRGRVGDAWQTWVLVTAPTAGSPPCVSTSTATLHVPLPVCALCVTWAKPGMQVSVCAPPSAAYLYPLLFVLSKA